jgi:hypothetical protein
MTGSNECYDPCSPEELRELIKRVREMEGQTTMYEFEFIYNDAIVQVKLDQEGMRTLENWLNSNDTRPFKHWAEEPASFYWFRKDGLQYVRMIA